MEEQIAYTIRRSARSRRASISVREGGVVVVTAPKRFSDHSLARFVSESTAWILSALKQQKNRPQAISLKGTRKDFIRTAPACRTLVGERLHYFNQFYHFAIGSIRIRDQKSRWGSCTRQGNLSFNYRLALIPQEYADYVIVHELCHIKEHNHSARFWALVAKTQPNWSQLKKKLNAGWRIA